MRRRFIVLFILSTMLIQVSCFHYDKAVTKVFKYDGSVQCDLSSAISLDEMQLELVNAGIDVICSQESHDGLARIALCGEATGNINVYTIHKRNLADAEALDYWSVNRLPYYQDQACNIE